MRKGLLLAGGTGSRLFPMTQVVSKQLLPVYDKPMIYYPLVTLMLAGIRDVQLISTSRDIPLFETLLGDGKQWGMQISYAVQNQPLGLADALRVGEPFVKGEPCALILGDNLFYGQSLELQLIEANQCQGACVFAYHVANPSAYGVIGFGPSGQVEEIEEKPAEPKSNYAMPGLYFFDHRAVEFAAEVSPSARGELEIVDVVNRYLALGELEVCKLGRGVAWLDTGTPDALAEATQYVAALERRQGQKVNCPEEVAWQQGWIADQELQQLASQIGGSYGAYLLGLLDRK